MRTRAGAGDPLPGSSKQSLGLLAKRKGVVCWRIPGKLPVSGTPSTSCSCWGGVRPAAAWDLRGVESLDHQEEAGMDTSVPQIRQGMGKSSAVGQEAVLSPSYRDFLRS